VPATPLAREAVDSWLRQQERKARHGAIAACAAEMAGTHLDLDTDLESAGIEHLVNTRKATRCSGAKLTGPILSRDPDRSSLEYSGGDGYHERPVSIDTPATLD
jgi:hypothetical protein